MAHKAKSSKRRVISIRWIVSGAAIALTTVTVLGVGGVAERNARQTLSRELQTRLMLEARNLALASSGALLSEFPELTLTPILSEIRSSQPELTFAVVVDLENKIRGHADARKIGEPFALPPGLEPSPSAGALSPGEEILVNPTSLVASARVNHRGGDAIGTAHVAIARSYIDSLLQQARRKQAILLGVFLAIGIVSALILMSVLLRPLAVLREGLERIGSGDLETPVQLNDRTELGLLAETMNKMSSSLKEARIEIVEKERLAREVELAREIQASLIPSKGIRLNEVTIDGSYRAALEVGGDYYDVLDLPDGRVGIAVADVSGKGLAGCLVTSMLSALLRAFASMETSPSALLVRLEQNLSLRPGTFITMFYGILDPTTGHVTFASAGHNPLLVVRAASGRPQWYQTRGIPLGAVRGGALAKTLEDEEVRIEPGDVLVQYTDGIHEAFDITGENQFGLDRLAETTAKSAPQGTDAVLDAIRAEMERWVGDQPPLDDETVLVVEMKPRAAVGMGAATTDAMSVLEEARRKGECLRLVADLDTLTPIRRWLSARPELTALEQREALVLESAIYELCANIAEHGYGLDRSKSFELWWLARRGSGCPVEAVSQGRFLVIDHGAPFKPSGKSEVDFADPVVRRRGRGFGLEIIQMAMSHVSYQPGTPAGNITVLEFDPSKIRVEEEVSDG